MVESDNIISGRVNNVLPFLKQRLNGYLATYGSIKVGATTDPHTRWTRGHKADGWSKMVVVYRADWPGSVRSMEKKLIAHAHATRFVAHRANVLSGGESIREGYSDYYVYVLVA